MTSLDFAYASPAAMAVFLADILTTNGVPTQPDEVFTVTQWANGTRFMAEFVKAKALRVVEAELLGADDGPLPESPFDEERAAAAGGV